MIKPPISDLVTQHDGYHVGEENTEAIDGVKTIQPATLFIIPTGEEVSIERKQISFKGILASNQDNLNNSRSQEINVTKKIKKNSTSSKQKKSDITQTPTLLPSIEEVQSPLLTDYDVKNRLRGYSLFLPETKEKCDEYWRVAYGVNLYSEYTETRKQNYNGDRTIMRDEKISDVREGEVEGEVEGKGGGYNLSEVTMQLGDKRILPSQMLARYSNTTPPRPPPR